MKITRMDHMILVLHYCICTNCSTTVVLILFSFQSGHFSEDMIPTVGFNMRKVTKGNVTIKVLKDRALFAQGNDAYSDLADV